MENRQRKKNTADIDEEYLMSIMAGEKVNESVQPRDAQQPPAGNGPAEKKTKTNKAGKQSYGNRFLKTHSMTRRGDKSIYIRPEYHERLSRIVQVIGDDQIPLYAYLDNILDHHFQEFGDQITQDFNDKYKPIL